MGGRYDRSTRDAGKTLVYAATAATAYSSLNEFE
jgi:hypothetical protein